MRILALNHFYDQDLEALQREAGTRHLIRWVGFHFFRERFLRCFPEEVLGNDLSLYGRPEHAAARETWRRDCRHALHELYRLFPFELLILPSDCFPYIRDAIPAAHELGIPVVVVQKETAISPYTLEVHSRDLGKHFPFVADHMTVCSERHKQFWINAGAEPDTIDVTGQPRFDFYRDPGQWSTLEDLGLRTLPDRKRILFLSYELGAYIPIEDFEAGRLSWQTLRSQTEETLLGLVNSGEYQLLVKPHPQQPLADVDEIRRRLASRAEVAGSAQLLPASLDTRQLLVNADVVVGFQTTALLEALPLGRTVVYTCWGDAYQACRDEILPYENHPGAIHSVRSAEELEAVIRAGSSRAAESCELEKLELHELYLGPADGRASARTFEVLEDFRRNFEVDAAAADLRERLLRGRRRHLIGEFARLAANALFELPLGLATWAAARGLRHSAAQVWALRQLELRRSHGRELLAALREAPPEPGELAGRRLGPWFAALREAGRRLARRARRGPPQ